MAWLWIGVAAVVVVGFLAVGSFVPLPGYFNVNVQVTAQEIPLLIGSYFSISSVQGSVKGPATLIDWGAASFALPALHATFTMTVCLNPGNHCTSKSASQWFTSIPVINGASVSATNTFTLGYIPSGQYSISVTLTQSGSTVATGSGSVTVG